MAWWPESIWAALLSGLRHLMASCRSEPLPTDGWWRFRGTQALPTPLQFRALLLASVFTTESAGIRLKHADSMPGSITSPLSSSPRPLPAVSVNAVIWASSGSPSSLSHTSLDGSNLPGVSTGTCYLLGSRHLRLPQSGASATLGLGPATCVLSPPA